MKYWIHGKVTIIVAPIRAGAFAADLSLHASNQVLLCRSAGARFRLAGYRDPGQAANLHSASLVSLGSKLGSQTSEILMLTRMRRGTTRIKTERGSNMVEFALIAPLLFFLMFAIMELAILFWVNLTMQYAVREGARYSITGQSNLDPALVNQQRYLAVIQRIKDSSMGMYSKVDPTISVNGISMATSAYNNSMFGAPGDIVVLQMNCVWPVVTPAWRLMALVNPTGKPCPGSVTTAGKYTFCVAATMRNEAFL